MAADKLIDSTKESACRTAEANAIRAKTGSSASITYDFANNKGFADAIAAISTGGGGTDVYEAINRTTNVNVADTNLSTVMARGIYAGTAEMAAGDTLTAGTIYVQYEA